MQSPDLTTDSQPDPVFSSNAEAKPAPESELESELESAKCCFKYDAALLYASDDDDLADEIFEEMNALYLEDGQKLKVCHYNHAEFGGSLVSRPRIILESCRFVFVVLTKNTSKDNVAQYTNEEATGRTKFHRIPSRRIFPLYTEEDPEYEVPDGLACEERIKWYKPKEKRNKQILSFLGHHRNQNTETESSEKQAGTSSRRPPDYQARRDNSTTNKEPDAAVPTTETGTNVVGCQGVTFNLYYGPTCNLEATEKDGRSQQQSPGGTHGAEAPINPSTQGSLKESRPASLTSVSKSYSLSWCDNQVDGDASLVERTHPVSKQGSRESGPACTGLPEPGSSRTDRSRDQTSFAGFRTIRDDRSLLHKPISDTRTILYHEKAVEMARSVGCIWSPCTTGTGFRVGTDLIMTCWHVIRDIIAKIPVLVKERGVSDILENDNVWIQFDYKPNDEKQSDSVHRFQFLKVECCNEVLDFAVVRLKVPEGKTLPPPITRFTHVGEYTKLHLIGHDRGKAKELDPGCNIEKPTQLQIEKCDKNLRLKLKDEYIGTVFEFYEGMSAAGRIHFHCAFQNGASGSPGAVFTDGQLYVATMLCRGYPNFYYNLEENERSKLSLEDKYFIEEGINLAEIWEHINKVDKEMCTAIFGSV